MLRSSVRRRVRELKDEALEPSLREARRMTLAELWKAYRDDYVRRRHSRRSPRTLDQRDSLELPPPAALWPLDPGGVRRPSSPAGDSPGDRRPGSTSPGPGRRDATPATTVSRLSEWPGSLPAPRLDPQGPPQGGRPARRALREGLPQGHRPGGGRCRPAEPGGARGPKLPPGAVADVATGSPGGPLYRLPPWRGASPGQAFLAAPGFQRPPYRGPASQRRPGRPSRTLRLPRSGRPAMPPDHPPAGGVRRPRAGPRGRHSARPADRNLGTDVGGSAQDSARLGGRAGHASGLLDPEGALGRLPGRDPCRPVRGRSSHPGQSPAAHDQDPSPASRDRPRSQPAAPRP